MSDNAYNRFQTLIGKDSLDVVTIVSDNGDGTSQATTLAGSTITVRGNTVLPGQNAFVMGGSIVRKAPNLTITEVSV